MKYINPTSLLAALIIASSLSFAAPTYSAETLPTFNTGVSDNQWVTIPKGDFFAGQHKKKTPVNYDYRIMVTPVTNQLFSAYLNEALLKNKVILRGDKLYGWYGGDKFTKYHHELEIKSGNKLHMDLHAKGLRITFKDGKFVTEPGWENHPVIQTTWFGAKAYCDAQGGRLPSEVEWEKAARGTDTRSYPWGDDISSAHANMYASHDPFEKIFGKQGSTTPVGFYNGKKYGDFLTKDARSPYGLYDMAGNVWNWTGDVYPNTHYRWMRGGSKNNYDFELRVYNRNSAGPDYHEINVGFRCVQAP